MLWGGSIALFCVQTGILWAPECVCASSPVPTTSHTHTKQTYLASAVTLQYTNLGKIRLRIQQEKKHTNIRSSTHKMHFIVVFLYCQSLCIRTHKHVCEITLLYTQFLTLSTIPHSRPLTKNVQKDTPTQTKHAQDFPVRDGFKRRIGEFFESFQETPHPLFLVTLNCLFAMERDFLPRHYMEYYTENNFISSTQKFRIPL